MPRVVSPSAVKSCEWGGAQAGRGGRGRGWRGFLGLLGGGLLLLGHEGGSGNAGDIGLVGSRHEGRGGASKSGKGQERQLHFGYIFPIIWQVRADD